MSRPVTPASHVPPAQGTLSRTPSQRIVSGASPPAQSVRSRANSQRVVSGVSAPGHDALSRSNSQRIVSTGSRPVSRAGGDATGVETTDHYSGPGQGTSILSQSGYHEEHPTNDAASGLQRTNSQMSQSATAVPSRGNTLKKKASLRGVGSVKRSGSKKSSYAGSVRSMQLGEKEKYEPSEEHNSAFYCPVPITGSPTDLLADRFQAWRKVLKDLINYFRDLQKSYETRSKTMHSASNVINSLSTPSNFMSSGGLADATHILRDFHKLSLNESNKSKELENEVIVQLTGLRSDLQQKIKEIKSLSGDFKNSVGKEQEGTRKAVRALQESLGSIDHDAASTAGKGDPFLIKMGVDRQLERHIQEENYLHRAYLNLEASGRELESIVVGEIQKAYNVLAGIMKREADNSYEAAEKLREGPVAMSKDHEWDVFVMHNSQMVDPRVPVRQVQQITYAGKDHPAAVEVRSGMLERKSKYLKNYTPGWYVLSPTHLHEFKSADRIAAQSPVMSLYLPEQKLGTHSEPGSNSHKFMLKGRQTGSMHRGHSWIFRAETHDTMLAWFGVVKELTEKSGEARNEYVRRTHARTVSSGSLKAPSIGSTGSGMEDDEADVAPFSGEQSIRGQSVAAEGPIALEPGAADYDGVDDNRSEPGWRPQRPTPGGRFPSDLNVQRGLQAPLSPSSGDSIDTTDREAIAAAGALPGSGLPFAGGTSNQPHTEFQQPQGEYREIYNQPQGEQQAYNQPQGGLRQAYQPPRPEEQAYNQPLGGFQQTRQQPQGEQQAYSQPLVVPLQAYSQPLGGAQQAYQEPQREFQPIHQQSQVPYPAQTHQEPQREFQQTHQPRGEQQTYHQPQGGLQQAYQEPQRGLQQTPQQPQAPYYAAQQSGNELAGAAGSANNDTAGISSYTAGDHKRVAPTSEGAVPIETASTYGEWMAPLAVGVGGAGLGAAGAHAYQQPQLQHQPRPEPEPTPQPDSERLDDRQNAIPASAQASAPIMASTAAPADAPTRPRAMTDSTQDTSVNTMTSSGYTGSTVPTSFGAGSETPASSGQRGTTETPPPNRPWGKSDPPLDTYTPSSTTTFSGHGAATLPHVRPEMPHLAKSVQTISDLHIPGEYPKAPATENQYRAYYE